MPAITTEFAETLSSVRRPGDFFASGTIELHAPRIEVTGVGPVALPLLPTQAQELIAVAERAPYGRGPDTVVDTKVRRTWQIEADKVRIGGKHWPRTLATILERVGEGLGVVDPIKAELYKLLVYDRGSFFVSHRDTEKAPGMFATLVVALPSTSAGGELVVRHREREVRLDLSCDDPSEAVFAAFYADCLHEVLPVTDGCRLVLVFNLLRPGAGRKLLPPSYERAQSRIVALLQGWAASKRSGELDASHAGGAPDDDAGDDDDDADDDGAGDDGDDDADPDVQARVIVPEKLIYPLEHAYTMAELGFGTLKGIDAAVAGVLVAAALQADCELHLALLSIEESGAAEYTDSYRGDSDEGLEAGEVFERQAFLCGWRRADGSPSALGEIPFLDEEVSPPDALEDMDPDEQHFEEATGNSGASFERTYRRAALVLWPRARMLAVLNQAGLAVTLPYLAALIERWTAAGKDRQAPLWQEAHALAGHMLSTWPKGSWYRPTSDGKPSEAGRMMALLTSLEDTDNIERFIAVIAAGGAYAKGDNNAILGALALFPPQRAAALLEQIIDATAATSFAACSDLLAHKIESLPREARAAFAAAAGRLVETLPGDRSRAPPRDAWARTPAVDAGVIADLLSAVTAVRDDLAGRTADHILAWPKTYAFDGVLVPALRQLVSSGKAGAPAVKRLGAACIAHLRTRIAEPLAAPQDWIRASTVGCRCPHCRELSRFLADPTRQTWTFKAMQSDRSHVEGTIRNAYCDLDFETVRRGSPHSLVCTKNQASYDRRVKQRKRDVADLAELEGDGSAQSASPQSAAASCAPDRRATQGGLI